MSKFMKVSSIVLILAILVFAGCARTVPVVSPKFTVAGTTQKATGLAIRDALRKRGWALVKEEPGRKVARYQRSSHSATISIDYTKDQVAIKLLESDNLKHGYDKNGNEVIHRAYTNWVKNLENDIGVNVSYR